MPTPESIAPSVPMLPPPQEETLSSLKLLEAKVTKVENGNTIYILQHNGQEEQVRLLGVIVPPESSHLFGQYGKEALVYIKNRLEGHTVYLEKDVQERDANGHLLYYVWLEQPKDDSVGEIREKMFNADFDPGRQLSTGSLILWK